MLTQDDDLSRRSQYLINNICNFSGSAAQSEPELSFVMICQHRHHEKEYFAKAASGERGSIFGP